MTYYPEETDSTGYQTVQDVEGQPMLPLGSLAERLMIEPGDEVSAIVSAGVTPENRLSAAVKVLEGSAYYVNLLPLTSGDRFGNDSVPDITESISDEGRMRIRDVYRELRAYRKIVEDLIAHTRSKVSSEFAWFSDSEQTFVVKAPSEAVPPTNRAEDFGEAAIMLSALAGICRDPLLASCPVRGIYDLCDMMEKYARVAKELSHLGDTKELDEQIEILNTKERLVTNMSWGYYLVVHFKDKYEGEESVYKGLKTNKFVLIPAPDMESAIRVCHVYDGCYAAEGQYRVRCKPYGPFRTVEDAKLVAAQVNEDICFRDDLGEEDDWESYLDASFAMHLSALRDSE